MSSTRALLVERNEQSSRSGLPCATSRRDAMDTVSYFALGFVFVGLIFAAIGFLYPRDIARDPGASARENEAADLEYIRLTDALNTIVITGMALIGLGGLILAVVFTNTVVCEECKTRQKRSDVENRTFAPEGATTGALSLSGDVTMEHDYGSLSLGSQSHQDTTR